VCTDICWHLLTFADICWHLLTFADICWHLLNLAGSNDATIFLRALIAPAGHWLARISIGRRIWVPTRGWAGPSCLHFEFTARRLLLP
jgi:hypothetical protein